MQLLQTIFWIYVIVAVVMAVLYLPRMLFFVSAFKKQKKLTNDQSNRFAVLVPARNESSVITQCLDSLKNQSYDNFDIHIIVNDPQDKTMEIALGYKNTFVHVIQNQKCKGDALDGAFKNILKDKSKYDAYVVIDADNTASKDFLLEMNNAMASGKQIICGKKRVKNWFQERRARTWVTNCTGLIYTAIDDLGNKFRSKHNNPVVIVGTGFLIRADVMNELGGWPFKTLTEDMELTINCILNNYTSLYYEHAVIYTEEPIKLKAANKRRLRWVSGFAQCDRKYRKAIKKKTFDNGINWGYFEKLYGLYPLIIFAAASIVMSVIGLLSWFFVRDMSVTLLARYALLPWAVMYVLLFMFTLLKIIVAGKDMHVHLYEKIIALFTSPLYQLQYFFVYIKAFFIRNKYCNWEVVERVICEANNEEFAQKIN